MTPDVIIAELEAELERLRNELSRKERNWHELEQCYKKDAAEDHGMAMGSQRRADRVELQLVELATANARLTEELAGVRERWAATFRAKANEAALLACDARDQGRQIAQAALNAEADTWNEAAELLNQLEKGA